MRSPKDLNVLKYYKLKEVRRFNLNTDYRYFDKPI